MILLFSSYLLNWVPEKPKTKMLVGTQGKKKKKPPRNLPFLAKGP